MSIILLLLALFGEFQFHPVTAQKGHLTIEFVGFAEKAEWAMEMHRDSSGTIAVGDLHLIKPGGPPVFERKEWSKLQIQSGRVVISDLGSLDSGHLLMLDLQLPQESQVTIKSGTRTLFDYPISEVRVLNGEIIY
jgi:hypothetical protein